MRLGIRPQALVLMLVPLVSLLAMLALTSLLVEQTEQGNAVTQQLASILESSDRLSRSLTEASAAVQLYTKSRRNADLAPYYRARAALPGQIRAFQATVQASPALLRTGTAYAGMAARGMEVLTGYLQASRSGGAEGARRFALAPATRHFSTDFENSKIAFDQAAQPRTLRRIAASRTSLQQVERQLIACEIVSFVLTVIVALFFARRIVKRLGLLGENAHRLAEGKPTLPTGGNDEIAELDRLYREMAERIQRSSRAHQETLVELSHQRDVTATLQKALLPEIAPIPGLRIDTIYATPETGGIGGDWFDVFPLSERLIGLSVGDVSGHGLRAAALMGFARQAIRIAARHESNPAAVMQRVGEVLYDEQQGAIVTAFFGVFDRERGSLSYTLAGHGPPLLVSASGTLGQLEGGGLLLGVAPRQTFAAYEKQLVPGDVLILYTDGIVEAERDYLTGMGDLEDAIRAELREPSANIAEGIQQRVLRDRVPHDDSAVLALTVNELIPASSVAGERTWTFDARIEGVARRVKSELLKSIESLVAGADLTVAELAFGELLSNVVRHTPGPTSVGFTVADGRLVLQVEDHGGPFPSNGHASGEWALPAAMSESGRGLYLVSALCERVTIQPTARGKRMTVVLPILVDRQTDAETVLT